MSNLKISPEEMRKLMEEMQSKMTYSAPQLMETIYISEDEDSTENYPKIVGVTPKNVPEDENYYSTINEAEDSESDYDEGKHLSDPKSVPCLRGFYTIVYSSINYTHVYSGP